MKKIGKGTIALIAVVAILGITVLTLGLIKIRPDKHFFEDYEQLWVYDLGSSSQYPSANIKTAESLQKVRFSVLGAMLEGKFNYATKIVKDDDGNPEYLDRSFVKGVSAGENSYLLHFKYAEIREIKVDGEVYEYDHALVFIEDGDGEVVNVRVVPYIIDKVNNDSNGVDSTADYEIADLRIKMRTSKLFVAIRDAIEAV